MIFYRPSLHGFSQRDTLKIEKTLPALDIIKRAIEQFSIKSVSFQSNPAIIYYYF